MRTALCTILAGLSLISSTAISKPLESRMDPLVRNIVKLLKTDPTTIQNLEEKWVTDLSPSYKGNNSYSARQETLITYIQKFREGDRTIVISYSDFDEKDATDSTLRSDGIIGPADSLSIDINVDPVQGKQRYSYGFVDGKLDRKLDGDSDSFYGDVLELGVRSKEAENYYDEKRTEIDQKYTSLLEYVQKRLTKKKE